MNVGILVDVLDDSQLTHSIIGCANRVHSESPHSMCAFYNDAGDVYTNVLSVVNMSAMWSFRGAVIATNLNTAKLAINSYNSTKRFFYVWDLEWINSNFRAVDLHSIYNNTNIELIARSESHAKAIRSAWREPVGIIEDFNYDDFAKIIF